LAGFLLAGIAGLRAALGAVLPAAHGLARDLSEAFSGRVDPLFHEMASLIHEVARVPHPLIAHFISIAAENLVLAPRSRKQGSGKQTRAKANDTDHDRVLAHIRADCPLGALG